MYSEDFRKLALKLFQDYKNYRKVSSLINISTSTLHRWVTKGINVTKKSKSFRKFSPHVKDLIESFVANHPFIYLQDIIIMLKDNGVVVTRKSLSVWMKILRFSKKKAFHHCHKINPVKEQKFKQTFSEHKDKLIASVDECNFSECILPSRGYSKIGTRLHTFLGPASWKQRSLLLAVFNDGTMDYKVHTGSINNIRFTNFITTIEATRQPYYTLDNASIHKKGANDRYIFTPPYQPAYNAVEYIFSKIKTRFRNLYANDRISRIEDLIEHSINEIKSEDIVNCFRHVDSVVSGLKQF